MRHCIKTIENESKANHPGREKGLTAKYLSCHFDWYSLTYWLQMFVFPPNSQETVQPSNSWSESQRVVKIRAEKVRQNFKRFDGIPSSSAEECARNLTTKYVYSYFN